MITTLENVSWEMSLQFIKSYNAQENKRFGASKLPNHIDNYNLKNPFANVLEMPKKGKSVVLSACNIQEWQKAKQFIMNFDTRTGDIKELVQKYVYYVTRRPKNDKLEIGRVPGRWTTMHDKHIIEALYDNKCIMCGEKKPLQIHHIENLHISHNRDIENQIPVCSDCHCKIHGFK